MRDSTNTLRRKEREVDSGEVILHIQVIKKDQPENSKEGKDTQKELAPVIEEKHRVCVYQRNEN